MGKFGFRRRDWVVAVALGLGVVPAWGQAGIKVDPTGLSGEQVRVLGGYVPLPINQGAAALEQLLPKLRTRASLMLIVAHPDDEDSGMLTYESRGQGARVGMLTLNRGEGGQNVMSADFNDALGLIRTQELLAEGRYTGVDQMFGTVVDFGFSKTKEETLAQWGYDRVLYDAVRAVRLYRPLVVASVFVGGVTDGHGHHQVAGQMAQEVFTAAADPKVFPEMGLAPWAPVKVYARVPFARVTKEGMFDYATGKIAPTRFYNYVTKKWTTDLPVENVVVHEGEMSPALGMTYLQFARRGLALQKTQMGDMRSAPGGAFDVGYTRYGSRIPVKDEEKSFFDGIDVTLAGIAALAPSDTGALKAALVGIDGDAAKAAAAFSKAAPEKSAPGLSEGLKALDGLIGSVEKSALPAAEKENVLHELRVKRVQFNDALALALGVTAEASVEQTRDVLPGSQVQVALKVSGGAKVEDAWLSGSFAGAGQPVRFTFAGATGRAALKVPEDAAGTRPYFSRPNMEQAVYDLSDMSLRNAAMTPYPMTATVHFAYGGALVEVKTVVSSSVPTMPEKVVPAVSVAMSPAAGIIPLGEKRFTLTTRVAGTTGDIEGTVRLELPSGWASEPAVAKVSLAEGKEVSVPFVVTPMKLEAGKEYTLTAVAEAGGKTYREGYRSVGYGELVRTNLYRPAVYRAQGVDVKVAPGLRVGYLAGTGDAVAASLENLGVKVTMLSVADVVAGKLAGYDAVVLGVRAYAAHPELRGAGSAGLLAFAKDGGTVIVQYVTGGFDAATAPYPMALGTEEKVVVETDPMTLLKPASTVLAWPNRLGPADFKGWVEEWGHGFMGTWDAKYEAPLEVHDPDQDPQRGGLLVARTGQGTWVYCALALYRQLPEGVPGAYRLFANLLSLGKAPAGQ
ncbi:PIG-L family deacetylase [Granulicella sp. WH15]|uniref:PIG-L family deacetylase n=1 Tax=Granulicella sp. WH15 TaxID=2602070 RepID=UPI0013671053|nr:PIG-L family deacetylase [Granulicella sp. WH15]QHN04098.1 PIG-L family deacetylase [Granulicella sp. WH15]